MSKIVARTLSFIELFAAEKRPLTLSDISRLLRIPFSSCHDVLREMQARGYLYEIGPRAGFYPTVRLLKLAETIATHDPVLQRAEVLLRKLRDELDKSVSLAKATGMALRYLLVFEPAHPLRFMVSVGNEVRSLYATSAGKAFLGSLAPAQFDKLLQNLKLVPMTRETIRSKPALRAEIDKSNRRGWFLNRGESVEDATTVSARFTWNGSTYIVTIAGPSNRMEAKLDEATKLLVAACGRLGGAARN